MNPYPLLADAAPLAAEPGLLDATEATPGFLQVLKESFYTDFIVDDRWKYLANGFLTTLEITFGALAVGLVLGFLIAIIRATYDKTGRWKIANALCQLYLTIIRGTPAVLQLLIIYFVVFASGDIPKLIVAILAFGINSGAYTAEIFRAGIMSIPRGQFEAASSLGLNYRQTMISIIMPQAFKTVLPALVNEFITLLKETSIAGYIAMEDLTKGGDIIRSITYDPYLPLLAVAAIYLICVCLISYSVGKLEKYLKRNE